MVPKRIGFLLFPEIQALDIAGAMDAFEAADAVTCSGRTAPVDWMASSPCSRWHDTDVRSTPGTCRAG